MSDELEVLRVVSERLESLGLRYMLTGSFAMAFYTTPRMTRDLDAVRHARLFNLMHLGTGLKADLIVRKDLPFRRLEFERRCQVTVGNTSLWVVSREDLILSKLVWMKAADSELQRRDVQALWHADLDLAYLRRWAGELTVAGELSKIAG